LIFQPSSLPRVRLVLVGAFLLAGCTVMPTSGPNRAMIETTAKTPVEGIQFVDLDARIARQLTARRAGERFSERFGNAPATGPLIGRGDVLDVSIWEAPPATLFSPATDQRTLSVGSKPTTLPEQTVDNDGMIRVPFVGSLRVAGRSVAEVETEIAARLNGLANRPQALVRIVKNASSTVTVIGDVQSSLRFALTPGGERVLDALAAAGGVRQPTQRLSLQLTRGGQSHTMALDDVIRDPGQNVPLRAGDVLAVLNQPLSLSTLGATGKNEEINFETQGISLAQALARTGGLSDARADARGVFIFRFEAADALSWTGPVRTALDGRVPVIYRIDLRDPASFFVAQDFVMQTKDVLYVSNASLAEFQKFTNAILPLVYPSLAIINPAN
jgi:polysaccharide biosynthesis/export protein